ncbi:amino acid adenylation domain-containing protein [Streptomyces sp. NBC_00853]|uniref:amino acid adenylation domain-containing protein n=1 Tax=Streptomyces sp. NBC_00853 TaxID=2903681 RepID=UPI003873C652|nr:amino acid adenylation domain-containing protein [Streptomyces sp. NBC_00853]
MAKSGIADVLPLTPLQEGMLFHSLYDNEAVDAYTVQLSLDLEGKLDAEALKAAGQALLRRHPNLAAGFRYEKLNRPVQVIPHDVELPWREVDLRERTEPDRLAELARLTDEERGRRFDLTRPPLLRFTLVRLADDRYRLLLSMHHILIDGWSFPVLLDELCSLYGSRGDGIELPRVTPYRAYLEWQARQDRTAAEEAWRPVLADVSEPTLLVADRTSGASAVPETFTAELSEEHTAALTELARSRGWTLNTVVQGVWGLLLSSLTGRDDVVFGATVSGRPPEIPGVETMVGLFINTLPVRVRLDVPTEPVAGVLTRLQDQQAGLLAHQHLGLTELQRLAGSAELFDSLLVFENYPDDPAGFDRTVNGVRISGFRGYDATHYPLSLIATPGRRLRLQLGFRPDLLDRDRVAGIADRLERTFGAVLADADRPLAAFDTLDPKVRGQVVTEWNATAHEVPRTTLPELFEAQAARTPEHTALVFQDESLSYAELNARANRLAHHLIGLGVGPEQRVALALPRSVELIVALQAVLKTGAAYLPVDPDYPAQRIAYMLQDAAPALVLATAETAEGLPGDETVPVLRLDDPATRAVLAAGPDTDVRVADRVAELSPDSPAYVIYTSGSTGRPKGVVVSHAAITNRLLWMQDQYRLTAEDRVLQKTPSSFDVSVWEFFWPLAAGATLVVARPGGHKDPVYLAELIRTRQVTTAHFVPSMLQVFLQEPTAADCTALRRVICSGEALPGELRQRFARVLDAELHNLYGPTEAAVDVTSWHCAEETGTGTVAIGRPVWNTRAYVLDSVLRPVAPGVAGDLYLAGVQLARGYLGRAGLTAERFVADPFGVPGERMYATGDVARWRADGVLEFVGRSDEQVKIRGFRVELGEVEAVLSALPGVGQAVVMVREDRPGDRRLVGYVVPADGRQLSVAELRSGAARQLPDHMVPSAFVVLDRLPLTPNGKLDRGALPAPEVVSGAGRVARSAQEEILCGLFAEVLGVARVGVDDHFFELGGHSLLATRLVSRVRSALGVELEIRELFEAPTPARLAAVVAGAGAARGALVPQVRPDVVPLSFAQRRQWFLNRLEDGAAAYNIPFAVRLTGELDRAALHAALIDLAERHETLRTVYPEQDGTPCQTILDDADVRLVTSETTEAELPGALAAEAARGFDLSAYIPLRARLFVLGSDEHVLMLTIHHIAADGWSLAPLVRDLSVAYGARVGGGVPQWSPLPVQYAEFALWQREVLGSEDDPESAISRQLAFWKESLAGLPEELSLPVDRVRPVALSGAGGAVGFRLDAGLHRGLAALARESRSSLFMVVQAGLAALLSRLGAGEDIVLGTPVAGRTDEALDDLVGFFVNTLVLRTDVSGDPTFRELVARVREGDLAAYAHQDVPFERLVEVLNPERSLARHPLFQVMLNLQNNEEPEADLPGVTSAEEPVALASSKFDLSFELAERFDDGAPDGIEGYLRYSSDLFDPETAEGLLARFVRVLNSAVSDPEQAVGRIEVLDEAERHRVLVEWNDTARELPQSLVPELFEAQAARTPDSTALVHEGDSLTYAQLDARANRLAHHLIAEGAGPEQLVAIALPRSVDQITAAIAVLKSGAAYLPIDPEYPVERIAFMIDDAGPVLLLTNGATAPGLPAGTVPQLLLDQEDTAAALTAQSAHAPSDDDRRLPLRPAHPAYVIYTSGSTGTPKGVVVEHRSVADYLAWTGASYPSARGAAILHSTLSFDLTVTALYTPLVTGGTVHLTALEEDAAAAVVDGLREAPCTFLKATPSHLPLLGSLPDAFSPSGELLMGGEALFGDMITEWRARHPRATVLNVYGPTEATVNCAEFRIEPGAEVPSGPVPIGRPQGNARLYVLDAGLSPTAPGVAGELYIAGSGIARGYLNRRSLTAERFVADPYGPSGARMYRTGDLARWRADGNLEYLGRVDDQVKVRGYRIELGEIESALVQQDSVAQAVVVVREDAPGDRKIIGYVVAAGDTEPSPAELRKSLAERLPDYMVPAAVVVLDALPLTAHGKLDRKALPAPDYGTEGAKRSARTPAEEILCGLFQELLGVPEVGIDDSFFDLGGDSIVSIQLVSRARKAGLAVTPRAVFQHKTVEALAAVVGGVKAPKVQGADTGTGKMPLLPVMHRLRERGGPIGRYSQSKVLRVPSDLGLERLTDALQAVFDHHDALRMRLERAVNGGAWELEIRERGAVRAADRVERVDVSGLEGDALRAVRKERSDAAWDRISPEQGAMFQAVWYDAGPGRSGELLLVQHHLVVDGVSWRILETDLAAAWQALADGKQPTLEPVGTSFRRWAEHLQEAAHTAERTQQLALWNDLLDVPDELLTERPLDPTQDVMATLRLVTQELSAECTSALLTTVPAAFNAGVNDVLLTTLALAVADWRRRRGGGEDNAVLVDLEGHGREEFIDGVDLSRTIGWFTNVYPVRLDPGEVDWAQVWAGGPAIGAALSTVKAQLAALPDNGMGFGLLRYVNADTSSALAEHLPRQIGFNYLGRFAPADVSVAGDWSPAPEQIPGLLDEDAPIAHALSVNALTEDHRSGPRLTAVWSWPSALFTESEVRDISENWARALDALVTHVARGGGGGAVPSDLSLAGLTQAQMDELEDELDEDDEELSA